MFEQLLNWFYPLLYVHFPISHYIICIPIVFRHIQVVCINFIWKNGWPASTIISSFNLDKVMVISDFRWLRWSYFNVNPGLNFE